MADPLHDASVPAVAPVGVDRLTIAAIETTPVVVPLAREYRGSYYRMRNRSTVITRVVTHEGIVGEAYSADEDATLPEVLAVTRDEIAPLLVGEDAFAY